MSDADKTKEQLIVELGQMGKQIAESEAWEAERKQTDDTLKDSSKFFKTVFNSTKKAKSILLSPYLSVER